MKIKSIKEVRTYSLPTDKQTRAAKDTAKRSIEGYAAVFNQPSKLLAEMDDGEIRTFYEVIEAGAFDEVLASDMLDCIYCVDHKRGKMISRTKAGTLQLSVDDYGLRFSSNVPNTTTANDLYEHITVGNYSENSFCFTVAEQDERWEEKADGLYRYISKVAGLYDVSSVVNPAYNGTSISIRGMEILKKQGKREEKPVEEPVVTAPKSVQEPTVEVVDELDIIDADIWILKNK